MPGKNYILKPTYTPVPSAQTEGAPSDKEDAPGCNAADADATSATGTTRQNVADSSIRAENEDDDGYDPYSDRREQRPLFERDPWE